MKRMLFVLAIVVFMTGCSAVHKNSVIPISVDSSKSIYIVKNPYQRNNMDKLIQDEINDMGLTALSGPPLDKNESFKYVLTYFDAWSWDLAPYLRAVEIQLIDPKTAQIVSRVRFENNMYLHTFPDEKTKVKELITKLFGL